MSIVPYWNAGELRRSARPGGSRVWYNSNASNDLGGSACGQGGGQSPEFGQSFPPACIERFDRLGFLPYTSMFVREDFALSGAAPSCSEPLSWKGNIFGPGTM